MKIIVSSSELKAIRTICENVENGSTAAILDCIDKNPLTERRVANDNSGDTMFVIDAEYMADALNETSKIAGIVWPCLKAAYSAIQGYVKGVADLAEFHAKRASHRIRRKQARLVNHAANTSDTVASDNIVKILKANNVKKVIDLPAAVQVALRNAYEPRVISGAEMLLEMMDKDEEVKG